MYDDDLSSIMVPFGMTIELYSDDSWTGESRTYQGPMFSDFNQQMECINVDDDFNDKTTSIIAYRNRQFGMAVGKWVPVVTSSYSAIGFVNTGLSTS